MREKVSVRLISGSYLTNQGTAGISTVLQMLWCEKKEEELGGLGKRIVDEREDRRRMKLTFALQVSVLEKDPL